VRHAPCPVLVLRPADYSAIENVPLPEPPCAECRAGRVCGAHRQPRPRAHVYHSDVTSAGERTGVLW
jgi:hypothetical protein